MSHLYSFPPPQVTSACEELAQAAQASTSSSAGRPEATEDADTSSQDMNADTEDSVGQLWSEEG